MWSDKSTIEIVVIIGVARGKSAGSMNSGILFIFSKNLLPEKVSLTLELPRCPIGHRVFLYLQFLLRINSFYSEIL